EPKSVESYGLGIQIVLDGPDGPLIGFGSEPNDLSPAGAERALAKARKAAVHDPEFVSLPRPGGEKRRLSDYHDVELMQVSDERLVAAGRDGRQRRGAAQAGLDRRRRRHHSPGARGDRVDAHARGADGRDGPD